MGVCVSSVRPAFKGQGIPRGGKQSYEHGLQWKRQTLGQKLQYHVHEITEGSEDFLCRHCQDGTRRVGTA